MAVLTSQTKFVATTLQTWHDMPQLNTMRVQSIQVRGGHLINQDIIFFKSYGSTLLGGSPHQYIQYVPFDLFATYSFWLKKKCQPYWYLLPHLHSLPLLPRNTCVSKVRTTNFVDQ